MRLHGGELGCCWTADQGVKSNTAVGVAIAINSRYPACVENKALFFKVINPPCRVGYSELPELMGVTRPDRDQRDQAIDLRFGSGALAAD